MTATSAKSANQKGASGAVMPGPHQASETVVKNAITKSPWTVELFVWTNQVQGANGIVDWQKLATKFSECLSLALPGLKGTWLVRQMTHDIGYHFSAEMTRVSP